MPAVLEAPIREFYEVSESDGNAQEMMHLQSASAFSQASSLFPELRGFTAAESLAYKESLSKLFHKTGRTLF